MDKLPMTNGQLDWAAYHAQRAAEFRATADSWRATAKNLAVSDPRFAEFAVMRANANDLFAVEHEAKAKAV